MQMCSMGSCTAVRSMEIRPSRKSSCLMKLIMVRSPVDRAWPRRWLHLCSSHSVPCSSSTWPGKGWRRPGRRVRATPARAAPGRERGSRVTPRAAAARPPASWPAPPRLPSPSPLPAAHADGCKHQEQQARAPPGRRRYVIWGAGRAGGCMSAARPGGGGGVCGGGAAAAGWDGRGCGVGWPRLRGGTGHAAAAAGCCALPLRH
jgi:hypothetical protein